MNQNKVKILAIETSCDETAASVIEGNRDTKKFKVLSNIVSSQIDLHAKTGGIVPEVASRAHVEAIIPVISEALLRAKATTPTPLLNKEGKGEVNNLIIEQSDLPADRFSNEAILFLQNEIDYIAVTVGPGLIGSLLVGYNAAKSLAYALNLSIIPINHIEGHIYSAFCGEIRNPKSEILNKSQISNDKNSKHVSSFDISASNFPLIALTVSGGHTSLTLMTDHGKYQNIGHTLDDAAGEAFDKAAKLLGLGYPGGPAVSKLAEQFRDQNQESRITNQGEGSKIHDSKFIIHNSTIVFPRPIINDGTFNFSFSGLKTAVLQKVINIKKDIYYSRHPEPTSSVQDDIGATAIPDNIKEEICAAFEDAVVDVLVTKTLKAIEKYKPRSVILAGGVAANSFLRARLSEKLKDLGNVDLFIPSLKLCGDNAVMIGAAAFYHVLRDDTKKWSEVKLDSNLEL